MAWFGAGLLWRDVWARGPYSGCVHQEKQNNGSATQTDRNEFLGRDVFI